MQGLFAPSNASQYSGSTNSQHTDSSTEDKQEFLQTVNSFYKLHSYTHYSP